MKAQFNTNATSVHSNRGNGQLGLLFLTLKGAVHTTLSTIPFVPPANPGHNPYMSLGVTVPQIAEIIRAYKESLDEFNTYVNTDKDIKSQLIAAVDEPCFQNKRHKHIGSSKVTTKESLNYLCNSYAKIAR